MWAVGFTINMMTLMALSLVIGILIDDAVVVRENIYRHMEHGEDPFTAARNGTSEIGLAVMATTFTILAVFLPVGFMTGIVGQFFKSFALTIAFAVSMSLLVAFTLDPMLSSRFVRYIPPEERDADADRAGCSKRGAASTTASIARYQRVLGWAIGRPWTVLAIAAIDLLRQPVDARRDRHRVRAGRRPRPVRGHRRAAAGHVVRAERRDGQRASSGRSRRSPKSARSSPPSASTAMPLKANLRVKTVSKRERERGLVEHQGRRAAARSRRCRSLKSIVADPEFMQGAPTQAPISVFVRGDDMDELQRLSDEIVAKIRQVPGTVDVDSTLESGQPEMVARVNREMAADLGFDVGSVAMQLRGMVEGVVPTKLRDGDKEYDIRVRLAPEFRNDFQSIARAPLYSPRGTLVRTVGHRHDGAGRRTDQHRARAAAAPGEDRRRALGPAARRRHHRRRRRRWTTVQMPANFEWGFAGDVELMQESAAAMGLAMLLADGVHLHRARVAVRVVLRAVPDHAVAAARRRRRAAGASCSPATTSACRR